jgi:hypothetical protein
MTEFTKEYERCSRLLPSPNAGAFGSAGCPFDRRRLRPREYPCAAAVSARLPHDSLNFGHNRPNDPKNLADKYRRFSKRVGFSLSFLGHRQLLPRNGIEIATKTVWDTVSRRAAFSGLRRFITIDPEVTSSPCTRTACRFSFLILFKKPAEWSTRAEGRRSSYREKAALA